jgi:hypothetical protein
VISGDGLQCIPICWVLLRSVRPVDSWARVGLHGSPFPRGRTPWHGRLPASVFGCQWGGQILCSAGGTGHLPGEATTLLCSDPDFQCPTHSMFFFFFFFFFLLLGVAFRFMGEFDLIFRFFFFFCFVFVFLLLSVWTSVPFLSWIN